jgi:hypothetical protein
MGMRQVSYLAAAEQELETLPPAEQVAIQHAPRSCNCWGSGPGSPTRSLSAWSSSVRTTDCHRRGAWQDAWHEAAWRRAPGGRRARAIIYDSGEVVSGAGHGLQRGHHAGPSGTAHGGGIALPELVIVCHSAMAISPSTSSAYSIGASPASVGDLSVQSRSVVGQPRQSAPRLPEVWGVLVLAGLVIREEAVAALREVARMVTSVISRSRLVTTFLVVVGVTASLSPA